MYRICVVLALVTLIGVLGAACTETESGESGSPPSDALGQMEVAFEGDYSRAQIKSRMDQAMRLYGLSLTEDNYSRAGSTLVALRREYGIEEMRILDYMVRSHVPGVSMTFPDAAGIAVAFLATQR